MSISLSKINHKHGIAGLVPSLVLLLTASVAGLHFTTSRIYNYRIAVVEGLVLLVALCVYRRDLLQSIPFKSAQFSMLVSLVAVYFVSATQSDFTKDGVVRATSMILWVGYFWLVVYLLKSNRVRREWLITAISLSCIIPIARIFLDYLALRPIGYYEFAFENLGPYSNIRHAGYHALAAYFFSLYFVLRQKHHFNYGVLIAGILLLFINLGFLLWTGGRQGILLVFIFTPLILLVYFRERIKLICAALLVLGVVFGFTFYLLGGEWVIEYLLKRFGAENVLTLGGRLNVWMHALQLVDGNYLLGIGPDSFAKLKTSEEEIIQPHNLFLQLLLDAGIFAVIIACASITLVLKSAFGLLNQIPKHTDDYCMVFLTLNFLLAYFVNSLADGIFYHVLPIYMFSMAMAIIVSQREWSSKSNSK